MKKSFKLLIAKTGFALAVFIISLFVSFYVMNRTQADGGSVAMAQASYPVVIMLHEGEELNLLHGYAQEMDVKSMRGTVYVTDKGRTCDFLVDRYGQEVGGILFEVRTMDGEHLVEQTRLEVPPESTESRFPVSFTMKDLIEYDTEYMLVILLEMTDGRTIRYYTRVLASTDETLLHLNDHLSFVRQFHEDTFVRPSAVKEYLEPDAEGLSDTLAQVSIRSPFALVTWEGLDISERTLVQADLYDLHGQTATITLRYTLVLNEEGRIRRYHVIEDYFTRRTDRGMYLIDFRRSMDYIFSGAEEDMAGAYIDLSVTDASFPFTESDGGSAIAFVNEGRLFVYHLTENRLTQVFGFFEEEEDLRTGWQGARIRILRMDEAGNILFRVTGYRNRGRHEGEVGTSVYDFNAQNNTIDELIWVQSTQSEEMLTATSETLGYVNGRGIYYSVLGNDVTAIDLYEGTQMGTVENLIDDHYAVSDAGHLLAWQEEIDQHPETITLLDMSTETREEITAKTGEGIRLFGFIGNDIVYGTYRLSACGTDAVGDPVYPCHAVIIRHFDGTEFSRYEAGVDGLFVKDVVIEQDRIILQRTVKEDEIYTEAPDDQIMRTSEAVTGINRVESHAGVYGTQMRIVLRDVVDGATCKKMIANSTVTEHLIPDVAATLRGERYFCLDHGRIAGIFKDPAEAVALAYTLCGQVVDEQNRYVYYRGNMTTSNQILAISRAVEGEDYSAENAAAVCVRLMLEYEGAGRNVDALLARGETIMQILEKALTTGRVLNLDGCTLPSVLYYVDLMCDYPVLSRLSDERYVLLIGFNNTGVLVFDPSRGTESVFLMGMADATAAFQRAGNHFITYIK